MAASADRVKREVLVLLGLVLVVDAAFIAGYYLGGLAWVPGGLKIVYTALWTAATLAVVVRGLGRIRAERIRSRQ